MRKKIISNIPGLLVGIFLTAFMYPLAQDVYSLTIGRLFSRYAKIELYSVSNTTLDVLNKYCNRSFYYEITFFRIENKGNEATKKNDRLKIQARGEILEITPKELNQRFEVDQKDKSIGYLNIGLLERGDKIEGALHSFSKIKTDRNEAQIGFDKIGSYELTGPNIL